MDKAEILFESYNKVIEETYDEVFQSVNMEDYFSGKSNHDHIIEKCLNENLSVWEKVPQEGLGYTAPEEYIEAVSDFEGLMELFKIGSKLVDEDLPELLLRRMKQFGDKTIEKLVNIALDKSILQEENGFLITRMAVKVLGDWKIDTAVPSLIHLLYELNEDHEVVIEEISNSLSKIGKPAVEAVVKKLEAIENVAYVEEYLLSVLAYAEHENKTDDVFRCMKNIFRKMDNKLIGAVYIADYGDGRAIPMLRGYVERNIENIDRVTYFEIKSAVERLGGNMDDLDGGFDEFEDDVEDIINS